MKDHELRDLVLYKYYLKRKEEDFIPINVQNFGNEIPKTEVFRISQQLHDKGLIEFKPLPGDNTIASGWGRITALGSDVVEKREMESSLNITFDTKDDTPQSLRRQLAQHRSNLNKLREDAAIYGAGDVPLRLQNQIEAEERAIAEIEAELAELEERKDKGGL